MNGDWLTLSKSNNLRFILKCPPKSNTNVNVSTVVPENMRILAFGGFINKGEVCYNFLVRAILLQSVDRIHTQFRLLAS